MSPRLSTLLFSGLLISPLLLFAAHYWLNLHNLLPLILLLTGGLLGAALNYFQFGFSSSFRSLLTERRTAGLRAIIWMLALAIVLFAPLLALEHWNQQSFTGFVRPVSLAIPLGAFVFGIGMQIGCGCTSGTLNRVGQLQPLSFTTLFFMVIGGTLAAFSYTHWQHLPETTPFAFQAQFGWLTGLAVQLLLLAGLYWVLVRLEQMRHVSVQPLYRPHTERGRLHPFLLAALSLAFLNAVLLLVSGSPWSISSIFPYWGTKLITLLSLPVDWRFWDYSMEHSVRLNQSAWQNPVSLTTLGVILGALIVTLLNSSTKVPVTLRGFSGSVIGGLIMGFGAVLASGCNIGAFFSGIASGSGHGWVWLVFALMGNYVGVKLRQKARLG